MNQQWPNALCLLDIKLEGHRRHEQQPCSNSVTVTGF